ncbi:MAG TPA: TIGR03560 family F420-dependent LLM class oxidoreductase [Steroidobacteraceae bacterium]|nr:TIGR03560 family F420-dependent LLM class oxidoreductase [Steroidobacteraceae bacterium]
MATVEFGVMLPQIKRSWQETRAAAEEMDRLGYHSVWFNDHLYGIPMPQIPILEAWTALAAVGAITTRAELGTLVSPIGFRNPALFAKMIATLDQITGGRVIVGLGSGWFAQEFAGYGIEFPSVQDRLAELDEGIQLMRRMWSEPQVAFAGRYFHTDDVYCEPKPARRPPLLIGGGGEKVLLKLVARHADIWNNLAVNLEQLSRKVAVLRQHCEREKRDPATLRISQQTMVVIGSDEADAKSKAEKAARIYGGHMGTGIAGTPAQCIDKIRELHKHGCSLLLIEFFGRDIREPAALFAQEVMRAFA